MQLAINNSNLEKDYDSLIREDVAENTEESSTNSPQAIIEADSSAQIAKKAREVCVEKMRRLFMKDGFVTQCLEYAARQNHIMKFTEIRVIEAMFALIRKGVNLVIMYNDERPEFPLNDNQIEAFITKWVISSAIWGIGGSLNLAGRIEFCLKIHELADVELPDPSDPPLIDYEVRIDDQSWHLWKERVPRIDVEIEKVRTADTVITTVDTIRHQEMLCSWLSQRVPFILCGPPGSGKTMTLISTLNALTDWIMVFVNFSSTTSPELILRSFDQHWEYKKTTKNEVVLLRPKLPNKWLIVFCDEINLPETDKYGTQKVISFLRQLTEQNGFYRPSDKSWVNLERIQFVGACNPPTDQGRHPMTDRFMRHYPLVFVDFPGEESLKQIYSTFNRAMLKQIPVLSGFAEPLTEAMVEFYEESQVRFTADQQPHYVYSPRELTRWKLAIYEALPGLDCLEDLVRLYIHEGLRLFEDRLVHQEEKDWCNETLNMVASKWFPSADLDKAFVRPVLFSEYLDRVYKSVDQDKLRNFIQAKLRTFNEEELDVPLVVFDSVVDHVLRIDRVLKQPLGHLLLVGASGVGKTTLARFVAWINNQTVFQIKAGKNYSLDNFDEDIRSVMRRSGVKGERICFIFDESNVLSSAFLERMNALLASGEVPGLFEGDDYTHLINQWRETAQKMIDSEDELYHNFVKEVQKNLHVVFTMNPANPDFSNRTASSPALFNRWVIDWFGEWDEQSLWQVAKEFTKDIELIDESFDNYNSQDETGDDEINPKHASLISSVVNIHSAVKLANTRLSRNAKKYNFITPRDYLDFIRHFISVLSSKKESLQEQELHLNTGLEKLKETEAEVINLQQNVLVKIQAELEIKNTEANRKLTLMLEEQNIAEKSREASIKTSEEVKKMQIEIAKRTEEVNNDLGKAEPALREAQESVNLIKPAHLNEMKAMLKPPDKVRFAVEAVCTLIYGLTSKPDWKEWRSYLGKTDFISTVLNFDKDSVTAKTKKIVLSDYINSDIWDIESIYNASKAAGPLAKWVQSLIEYADIFLKIEPLRNEVAELERKETELFTKSKELTDKISELEHNIEQYKRDYALLIAEVERIKSEMDKVTIKVDRSRQLIKNLSSERIRWDFSSQDIKNQNATLIGDCLLSGAFLTYIGFFDHSYRKQLNQEFKIILANAGIKYKDDLSYLEFLSKASERLEWQGEGLPNDDIWFENAIIFKYYNRYPLIIDPSEQAFEFILKHYEKSKIQKTSFVDDAFMKQLESSIRFGYPLLVQDVEKYDPILNSVLNKEIHNTNGRVLIRVGDQDIDFSPSFKMYMITRDSQAQFTPDLCSRVTFCNFTVTPSSLQNQCLNIYLKNERPEIEHKRQDLLKLQGEWKVLLRELEDKLLNTLSTFEGSILENDQLISTLETIKKESIEIQKKVDATDETIHEIELVSDIYLPLSIVTSRTYFTLENMPSIHFLYQFSLEHYMDTIFELIRDNKELNAVPKSDPDARLKLIFDLIFIMIYRAFSPSLLYQDKILFALRLAQIKMEGRGGNEFDILMKTPTVLDITISSGLAGGKLSDHQLMYLQYISTQPQFQYLIDHMESNEARWVEFIKDPEAENNVPELPGDDELKHQDKAVHDLKQLTLIKIMRPDRFSSAVKTFIQQILACKHLDEEEVNFSTSVEEKSQAKSPLLLISAPGYDASTKVEELAKVLNKKLFSIAIGSAECYDIAEKNIVSASKIGGWVLLKNVHLAPGWLVDVEKKLHRLNHHKAFRVFMTMEFSPKIPTTLLRMSMKYVFEPPSGIKASLIRTYQGNVNPQRSEKAPKERCRMHFLLSWFHAVIQERLRYTPIGWSKKYEFNETDQRASLDAVDEWITKATPEMSDNIDPKKIPWDAIRILLSETIYGGKIDNEYDQKILNSLTEQLFTPRGFESSFALFNVPKSSDTGPLIAPEGRRVADYKAWIDELPSIESPLWCGLPANVDDIIKQRQVLNLIEGLKQLQGVEDEEAAGLDATAGSKGVKWMQKLESTVTSLIALLPEALPSLPREEKSLTDPLFRFLEREVLLGNRLLKMIKKDLSDLKLMCLGELKITNELREVQRELELIIENIL